MCPFLDGLPLLVLHPILSLIRKINIFVLVTTRSPQATSCQVKLYSFTLLVSELLSDSISHSIIFERAELSLIVSSKFHSGQGALHPHTQSNKFIGVALINSTTIDFSSSKPSETESLRDCRRGLISYLLSLVSIIHPQQVHVMNLDDNKCCTLCRLDWLRTTYNNSICGRSNVSFNPPSKYDNICDKWTNEVAMPGIQFPSTADH